jgi:hypothetical protein
MLTTVLAGLKAVGGFFVGAANAAFKWAGFFFVYRLAIRRERQRAAETTGKIQDEQLKIAAKPPLHRSTLLERMRGRKRTE